MCVELYYGCVPNITLLCTETIEILWSNKMFSGHPDFKRVMARNRFEKIRACLNLKVEGVAGDRFFTIDPLHSAKRLLYEVSNFFVK